MAIPFNLEQSIRRPGGQRRTGCGINLKRNDTEVKLQCRPVAVKMPSQQSAPGLRLKQSHAYRIEGRPLFEQASATIPTVDALTVIGHGARSVGYALAVHGSAAVYGLALGSWLLWARASATAAGEATA